MMIDNTVNLHCLGNMVCIVVVAMVIVLLAMMIDLASGLYKAKLRGEIRTSEGLRRTLMKFITYEGGMMIAAGVDALITMSMLERLFHLDMLFQVPVVTILVGIFLLVVEFLSVREKADDKTKKNFSKAEELAIRAMSNEDFLKFITGMYNAAMKAKEEAEEE